MNKFDLLNRRTAEVLLSVAGKCTCLEGKFGALDICRQGTDMALTSKITPYTPTWPARFLADKPFIAFIVSAFGEELIAIHHVGSTCVPRLTAKLEIDVLIEVYDHGIAALGRGSSLDPRYD